MSDPNAAGRPRRARAGVMRHARAQRRHPVALAVKLVASVVAVAVVSTLGIAGIAVGDVANNLGSGVHIMQAKGHTIAPEEQKQIEAASGEINLLILASDTRTGQGPAYADPADQAASSGLGNNDVTILVHISADHSNATIVSIPRDLVIPIPECPKESGGWYPAESAAMMNSTLSRGGLSCPTLTVEKLTGIDNIPYVAEVEFDGVVNMANAVGGVQVCVASAMHDKYVNPPLDLQPGLVTLTGPLTASFLRSRHGLVGGSDLSRISNQQLFFSALLRKVTSAGTLGNPIKLYSLAQAATQNMILSDTLTKPTTLVKLALALKGIPLSRITFVQYPVIEDPYDSAHVIPDPQGAPLLDKALQTDTPVDLTGGTGYGTTQATSAPSSSAAATSPATTSTSPATADRDGSTAAPTSSPSTVQLDQNTTGQTAADQTCARGD